MSWFKYLKETIDVYTKFTKSINSIVLSKRYSDDEKIFNLKLLLISMEDKIGDVYFFMLQDDVFTAEQYDSIIVTHESLGIPVSYSLS